MLNGVEWAACLCSDRAVLAFSRGVGIHFLAPHHEIHEPLQIFKKLVSGHRLKVLEKLLARSGRGANHLVARIGHFQKRVQAEGQQLHVQQQAGDMFFALASQRLADVIITRNAFETEEETGVIAAVSLLHVLLKTEERGTLHKE
ncbi:MAG: hypothetical protein NTV12_04895, partial [Verrucomicrobia bacterium]|nr:hypothetical protein [Verrucomicrobiota bacterium]